MRSGERNQCLLSLFFSAQPTGAITTPARDLWSRRLLPIPRAFTVADDGSPGSPVVDAAHGLIALRARRVLGATGEQVTGLGGSQGSHSRGWPGMSAGRRHSPRPRTYPDAQGHCLVPHGHHLGHKSGSDRLQAKREERWEPARGCGGTRPVNTVETGAGTGGNSPRGVREEGEDRGERAAGAGGMRRVPARTEGTTRGGQDVGGGTPGTRRGDHGQDAGVTREGLIPGRLGRHGGRRGGPIPGPRGAGVSLTFW